MTALFLAAFLQAATTPAKPLVLWNNLTAGISKAEFKARYPTLRSDLGNGCVADVRADFDKGKLETVRLEYSLKDTNKRCGEVVTQALFAKYGEPLAAETDVTANDCGNSSGKGLMATLAALCEGMGGDEPTTTQYHRWVSDGVEITLKRDTGSESTWWLAYREAVGVSAEVKNKL